MSEETVPLARHITVLQELARLRSEVEELTEKRQKALESVQYASRNIIYAIQAGDTIPGESEWLERELERAVRRALNVGCTTDEIAKAQVAAEETA